MRLALAPLAFAPLALLAACDAPERFTPADFASAPDDLAVRANVAPPAPPMVWHGGPVLKSMQLWTLVWAGDEQLGAEIDAFHAAVFASQYWSDAVG